MANYINNSQSLLHPELMSNEQLMEILTLRCIKLSNKESLNRYELLELYNRIALPLQQRTGRHAIIATGDCNGKIDEVPIKINTNVGNVMIPPSRKIKLNRTVLHNECETQRKLTKIQTTDEINKMMDSTKFDNQLKRNNVHLDVKQEPPTKKTRQKITWP